MEKSKKRQFLTLEKKLEIISQVDSGLSLRKAGQQYGVSHASVQTIMDQRTALERQRAENADLSRKKLAKSTPYDDVNNLAMEFFKRCRQKNIPLTGPLLQAKAKNIAESLGISEFAASNGWLQKFCQRNNIAFKELCGESADADKSVAENWKKNLPEILAGYQPSEIFNCDETALFYRQMPTKSLVEKSEKAKGGKVAKERLTVMLCCSSTGEKLKPLVIGNAARPRAFHKNNIKPENLPVTWRSNKTAWMTGQIFTEWLGEINTKMKREKRFIALLLDNAGCHTDVSFPHVKLFFLPPNLTSEVQPLDQGIIRALKALYRKRLLTHLLAKVDDVQSATEFAKSVTALDAIYWTKSSWDELNVVTIQKCFSRCGVDNLLIENEETANELVDVYEAVPEEMRNDFPGPHEFVGFDDLVSCTDDVGESVDEILNVVLVSHAVQATNAPDSGEDSETEAESAEDVPKTYDEACAALHVVEKYAFSASSASVVELIKSVEMLMAKEHAAEKLARAARQKQKTMLDFFPKIS